MSRWLTKREQIMSLEQEYSQYLIRFDELVGTVEIGQVGAFKGKLVKKLSQDGYKILADEYRGVLNEFETMVKNAQTIDERVMMRIRKSELELLIVNSPVLP